MSSPTSAPPTIEAIVPNRDIAPFVPGGTGLRVVIKNGLDFDRMPSSDARVSPRQQAKCLFWWRCLDVGRRGHKTQALTQEMHILTSDSNLHWLIQTTDTNVPGYTFRDGWSEESCLRGLPTNSVFSHGRYLVQKQHSTSKQPLVQKRYYSEPAILIYNPPLDSLLPVELSYPCHLDK